MQLDFNPSRLTRWLVIFALTLAALSWVTGPSINLFGIQHPANLWERFNLDGEGNIPTWFKSTLLLAAAITTAVIARGKGASQDRFARHWQALALVLTVMSMDEVSRFHERLTEPVRNALHLGGLLYYAWIIPAGSLVLLFATLMLRFYLHLEHRHRIGLALGGFVYLLGAIGFESLGGYAVSHDASSLVIQSLVTLEEGSQMIGSIILLHTLLAYLSEAISVRFSNPAGQPQPEPARLPPAQTSRA